MPDPLKGRMIEYWLLTLISITVCDAAGVIEIRFQQFHVDYAQQTTTQTGVTAATTVSVETTTVSTSTSAAPNSASTLPPVTWRPAPTCPAPARYRFLLCIDLVGQPEQCSVAREETELLQITQGTVTPAGERSDIVVFGDVLRRTPTQQMNPFRYRFGTWPGSLSVSVRVQCCGVPDSVECEEKLNGTISAVPATDQRFANPTPATISNRGRLLMSITVICSPNYFGVNCSTFCRDDNQFDNRICNPSTGQLVCSQGWTGQDCTEDVNECELEVCRHEAGCNNLPGSFTCHCRPGSSGRLCEFRTPVCTRQPCLNGGKCHEGIAPNDFRCECMEGWQGHQCEVVKMPDTSPSPVDHSVTPQGTGKDTQHAKSDLTLWYVGIGLLALTCLVIIILIICVICNGRRRRYQITELGKPETSVSSIVVPASGGQYDNKVYIHDPEEIHLQPVDCNIYQRALHPDDPYENQRALYEDRILPDSPYEDTELLSGGRRQGVSSAPENLFYAWGTVTSGEDSSYESVILRDSKGKKGRGSKERLPTYYRSSDPVPDDLFDLNNVDSASDGCPGEEPDVTPPETNTATNLIYVEHDPSATRSTENSDLQAGGGENSVDTDSSCESRYATHLAVQNPTNVEEKPDNEVDTTDEYDHLRISYPATETVSKGEGDNLSNQATECSNATDDPPFSTFGKRRYSPYENYVPTGNTSPNSVRGPILFFKKPCPTPRVSMVLERTPSNEHLVLCDQSGEAISGDECLPSDWPTIVKQS